MKKFPVAPVVFLASPAHAADVADFTKGRAIGGGYDLHARLLAAHPGKHIPGDPMSGGELDTMLAELSAAPKDIIAKAAAAMAQ